MRWIVFMLLAVFSAQPALAAKLYKCIDAKGKPYYTDKLTSDCVQGGTRELSKRGVLIKEYEPGVTPGQKTRPGQAQPPGPALSTEQQRALQEQQRRDRALLATYADEKEIDLARDRNLQQSRHVLKSLEGQDRQADEKLKKLQDQGKTFTDKGKPVPDWLQEEIASAERDAKRIQADIASRQQEINSVRERFEADKQRYRELKGSQ